jgi:Protein of unknown function (DUF4236)
MQLGHANSAQVFRGKLIVGFRFRRSIRLLPGLRVNLSKSGTSVSLGGHGATVNVSKRGTRATVGLPGTGISYSQNVPVHHEARAAESPPEARGPVQSRVRLVVLLVLLGAAVAVSVWARI